MIGLDEKQSQISGVNVIRNSRDNTSYTADGRDTSSFAVGKRQFTGGKRQKSQKIQAYNHDHRQYSHQPKTSERKNQPVSALRKNHTYKKEQMPKELPNIDNNQISDIFSTSNNPQIKKRGQHVSIHNHRIMLKSQPKPSRLL